MKKHLIHLEDGRKADKIVQETADPTSGESTIVTEIHVEPKIEKHLAQRIVETKKPIVVRREIESVDEVTGEVVERRVESLAPEAKMELREHIQTNASVAALGAKEDCDCFVTQEDMQRTFTEGFMAVARALNSDAPMQSGNVTMQDIVADKVEGDAANSDWMGKVLWVSSAMLAALLVYVLFFM